jgi:CrcB protein
MLAKILCVAAGGALGAISRYAVGLWAAARLGQFFPWGTFIVNLSGCALIGLLAVIVGALPDHGYLRPLIVTGFLGALTTFSTFCFESWEKIERGELLLPALNIIGSCLAGLVLVWLGLRLGRLLLTWTNT